MSRFDGLSERSRVLPAVTAGAAVLVFALVAQLFSTAIFYGTALFQGADFQLDTLAAFLSPEFILVTLAFGVGVSAFLWLFAPLSARLPLGTVIVRSLLAVVAGAILMFLAIFAIDMQSWLANANFFSNSLGQATESFVRDGGNALLFAVSTTLGTAVHGVPLTVLAVVLVWSWLVKHAVHQSDVAAAVEV